MESFSSDLADHQVIDESSKDKIHVINYCMDCINIQQLYLKLHILPFLVGRRAMVYLVAHQFAPILCQVLATPL